MKIKLLKTELTSLFVRTILAGSNCFQQFPKFESHHPSPILLLEVSFLHELRCRSLATLMRSFGQSKLRKKMHWWVAWPPIHNAFPFLVYDSVGMSLRSTIICFASIVNNAQTLDCSVQQFTLKTLQSPSSITVWSRTCIFSRWWLVVCWSEIVMTHMESIGMCEEQFHIHIMGGRLEEWKSSY